MKIFLYGLLALAVYVIWRLFRKRSLAVDVPVASDWLVDFFKNNNEVLDYSPKSIEKIDEFIEQNIVDGQAKPGGLIKGRLGYIIFAMCAYVGEVIRRNCPDSSWRFDDKDPAGELNMEIVKSDGSIMWPAQKVIKRIQNGEEDNLYHYVLFAIKNMNS